jgi:hypothetical protein
MKSTDAGTPPDLAFLMEAYDWVEAMRYAPFKFEEIEEVLYARTGEPDGVDWKLVVLLKNGKIGWLHAGCDYTGWDCRAGGDGGITDREVGFK